MAIEATQRIIKWHFVCLCPSERACVRDAFEVFVSGRAGPLSLCDTSSGQGVIFRGLILACLQSSRSERGPGYKLRRHIGCTWEDRHTHARINIKLKRERGQVCKKWAIYTGPITN